MKEYLNALVSFIQCVVELKHDDYAPTCMHLITHKH